MAATHYNREAPMKKRYFLIPAALLLTLTGSAFAGGSTIIGGALGGAAGSAIGESVGGRNGAILGGALGGGAGAAIGHDYGQREEEVRYVDRGYYHDHGRHRGWHHHHHDRD